MHAGMDYEDLAFHRVIDLGLVDVASAGEWMYQAGVVHFEQ